MFAPPRISRFGVITSHVFSMEYSLARGVPLLAPKAERNTNASPDGRGHVDRSDVAFVSAGAVPFVDGPARAIPDNAALLTVPSRPNAARTWDGAKVLPGKSRLGFAEWAFPAKRGGTAQGS